MLKRIATQVFHFFPLQLIGVLLRRNFLVLLYWYFLFAVVTNNIGSKYGIPNLLLFPEYLGRVDFFSHFILGFSVGGFFLAFHLAMYILHGASFDFIATLNRPFYKFMLNNSLIPTVFVGVHLHQMFDYQSTQEYIGSFPLFLHLTAYLLGLFVFLIIGLTYFITTNTNAALLFGFLQDKRKKSLIKDLFYKNLNWYSKSFHKGEFKTLTYLSSPFKISIARSGEHYDKYILKQVFAQNHLNASIFQIIVVFSIVVIGSFREQALFNIPAGASILLFITLLIFITSAIYSWTRKWSGTIFLVFILAINLISSSETLDYENRVYGLNYTNKVTYNNALLQSFATDIATHQADSINMLAILNKWKKNYMDKYGKKPPLILLNTSGGGLRSAYWTFKNLQHLDTLSDFRFTAATFMISGSSGGMIGAAFYRELYRQKMEKETLINWEDLSVYESQLTTDLLNPILMSLTTHDLFLRNQEFEWDGDFYRKDRAYAFEKQLNNNLNNSLNRSLGFYKNAENEATIPLMVFTPSIKNDGRRLIISNVDMAFTTYKQSTQNPQMKPLLEAVEFSKLFKNNDFDKTKFSSVLRMNATFPYILPNVKLPTIPSIEVMDAGVRDNYGMLNSLNFIEVFDKWIKENTSGVFLLQLNDVADYIHIKSNPKTSIFQDILSPAQGFTENWLVVQKFNIDRWYESIKNKQSLQLHYYKLELIQPFDEKISLSWHLTQREKLRIGAGIHSSNNNTIYENLQFTLEGN